MLKRLGPVIISGLAAMLLVGWVLMQKYGPVDNKKKDGDFFGETENGFCINEVCLSKEKDKWLVDDGQIKMPANQEIADIYQKRFKEIELLEMVSNNETRFESLGIGNSNGVVLEIGGLSLEIGNVTFGTSGTYVRKTGEKVVYRIGMILDKNSLASVEHWQNKQVTNLPLYQIKKVVITDDKKTITLEPKEGKWENQKLIEKVAYLPKVKFLPGFSEDKSLIKTITVTTESETAVYLGKKRMGGRWLYWASTDRVWFYEIKATDYFDLTEEK